jgi:hypothetical protein
MNSSISTPRPTIDVNYSLYDTFDKDLQKKRQKVMKRHIHTSHLARSIIKHFRTLQINLIKEKFRCSQKDAIQWSIDPSPYEDDFIFYCLTKNESVKKG